MTEGIFKTDKYRQSIENPEITLFGLNLRETEDKEAAVLKKVNDRVFLKTYKSNPIEIDEVPKGQFVEVDQETFDRYVSYLTSQEHIDFVATRNLIKRKGFQ